jgi:hypothetical protein
MSDKELIRFADDNIGLVIPAGTKRGSIITRIVNAAEGAHDGWPN